MLSHAISTWRRSCRHKRSVRKISLKAWRRSGRSERRCSGGGDDLSSPRFRGEGDRRRRWRGFFEPEKPFHHAAHGPPPLQMQGRKCSIVLIFIADQIEVLHNDLARA